jgi:hypothetical protein
MEKTGCLRGGGVQATMWLCPCNQLSVKITRKKKIQHLFIKEQGCNKRSRWVRSLTINLNRINSAKNLKHLIEKMRVFYSKEIKKFMILFTLDKAKYWTS